MLTLWLGAMLMLVVVLVLILPTLFGLTARRRDNNSSPDLNVQIYRERLAALEAEHRAATLSESEFERARVELDRELLADAQAEAGADADAKLSPAGMRRARGLVGLAVAVVLPIGAVALYWSFGPGDELLAIAGGAAMAPASRADEVPTPEQIGQMVANLAEHLEQTPDDLEGWRTLARSYQMLERPDEALTAYERALQLAPDDTDLLVDAAEMQGYITGNRLVADARGRIERALSLDPDHEKGLWLGGLAALQAQERALAKTRLGRLLALQPAESPQTQALRKLMQDAGLEDDDEAAGDAMTAPAPAVEAAASLLVSVTIAPELAQKLNGTESVYVFARDGDGPPMPVAATRRTASELPLTVELGDAQAMMPSRKLSDVSSMIVSARVSMTGDARAAPGDLEATAVPVARSNARGPLAVDLLIDKLVE